MPALFLDGAAENTVMVLSDRGARSGFNVLATRYIPEAHLCASTDRFQVVSKLIYEGTPPQPRRKHQRLGIQQVLAHSIRSRRGKGRAH